MLEMLDSRFRMVKRRCPKRKILPVLCVCLMTLIYSFVTIHEIDSPFSVDDRIFFRSDNTSTFGFEQRQQLYPCPELRRPRHASETQSWQTLDKKDAMLNRRGDKIYLFSAYFDDARNRLERKATYSSVVRIVAIKRSLPGALFCHVWYDQGTELLVLPATMSTIQEHKSKRYKAVFITCELPTREAPYAVSVVRNKCDPPQNLLVVQQSNSPGRHHYTVCVTPLNLNYNNVYQLVEMMEVNMLFGADSFVFYNYSAGPDVSRILEQYQKESIAEVIQWHIPVKVDTWPPTSDVEIHYFGQLAALNDCLYRRRSSDYVVFTDLDELIIPRKHRTWSEMLAELNNEDGGEHDIFMFRCAFFRKDWPDLKEDFLDYSTAVKYKLNTLLKVQREPHILRPKSRSKLMVKPLKVETIGIHQVWSALLGSREFAVPPSAGLLHHYRDWQNPNDTNRETDKNLHRFQRQIIQKIRQRWENLSWRQNTL